MFTNKLNGLFPKKEHVPCMYLLLSNKIFYDTAVRLSVLFALKGQIISKCLCGVLNFFQKMNKNTSHTSKKQTNEYIC